MSPFVLDAARVLLDAAIGALLGTGSLLGPATVQSGPVQTAQAGV
jgi:hypothetical protein